jgi:hypothetical protein
MSAMVSDRHFVSGLLALAGLVSARPTFAAERACLAPTLETDARVREQWPDLSLQIHSVLSSRADIDACAQIRLRERDSSLLIEVTLPDGRHASRAVSHPEDVLPSLEALLLVPPGPTERSREAETDLTARPPIVSQRDVAIPRAPANKSSTAERRRVTLELSLATGAGIGAGQIGISLGAITLLEVSQWLFGFEGRGASYQALSGGPHTGALELALLAGRRVPLRSLALDFIAGPGLALQGGWSVAPVGSMAPPVESNGVTPRLLLGTHLVFGARSPFRGFVGIDGEVGLARSAARPPDGAQLPAWTAGLALGATLGTQ